MERIINILSVILLFLMGSCHATYRIPVHTKVVNGTDTVDVKGVSLPLERYKVLFVYGSDSLDMGKISVSEVDSAFMNNRVLGRTSGFSSSFNKYMFKGKMDNRFYDLIASYRAADELRSFVSVMEMDSQVLQSEEHLDSLCRAERIEVVIMNKNIDFRVNQEEMSSEVNMDSSFGNEIPFVSTTVSAGGESYSSVVDYKACWRLYWIDYSAATGFRKETIVQQGGFWNSKNKNPETDVMSCALKAGEDFARLFKKR